MIFSTTATRAAFRWISKSARWKKIAYQHPDNPVGQFCARHFSRIARVLRTQRPLYARNLMADKERRLPLLPALKNYLSLKSPALRNAARISVMLSIASLMGSAPAPAEALLDPDDRAVRDAKTVTAPPACGLSTGRQAPRRAR